MTGMHEILRDGGDQTLVHVPPSRVASATYSIEDLTLDIDAASRVLGSGSATVDALSETTTAASGVGQTDPRRIAITSSAAVVGRQYEIVSTDGTTERLRVEAVTSTGITVFGRMSGLYPTGSTLRGIELRATFPSASAANDDLSDDERPLRVVWSYTHEGRTVRMAEPIRIVRQSSNPSPWIAAAELRMRESWPELVSLLGSHGSALRTLVHSCATTMAAKLRTLGLDPAGYLAGEPGLECLILAVVWECAKRGKHPHNRDPDQWAEEAKRDYLNMYNATTKGPGLDAAEVNRVTDTASAGHRPRRALMWAPM